MPTEIATDLSDLAADTLITQAGSYDGAGDWSTSGSPVNYTVYIEDLEGPDRFVRDAAGREVLASVAVYVFSAAGLTVDGHRYQLPARYPGSQDITARNVLEVSDENGAHHEVVILP